MHIIDFDSPNTYAPIIDNCVKSVCNQKGFSALSHLNLEYIDDAVTYIQRYCDLADLFFTINNTLLSKSLRIYHATRLSPEQGCAICNNEFSPLLETDRIERLKNRIQEYCNSQGFPFNEARFQSIVEKHGNRDNGRVYFSLSRNFHLTQCPEYLHFGSEFEVVVVVSLLGRRHRKLLKLNTNSAFISWEIPAIEAIDETRLEDVISRLETGNYPELANFLLNPWLLWKVGRTADIRHLNADFSLIFKRPFPDYSQTLEWVSESHIARYAP